MAVKATRGLEPELDRLNVLVDRATRGSIESLSDAELFELVRLYRFAATRLSLYETEGRSPESQQAVQALAARAHACLATREGSREPRLTVLRRFYASEVPRTIRAEWKLIAASFALIYGLAALSWWAVARDMDVAWSLFDSRAVANEITQLQSTTDGAPFRGNFTFGLGQSAENSGMIMAHNMFVGVLFFAAALLPPLYLYLLSLNGLMIGTYTGVAGHYGQAGNISSILWCHGTLEIQALVLAGAAGLVLVRAWVAPGPRSRRFAMRVEAARSWQLLAAVFPMLFFAGLIEGFVSPHAPFGVRIAVAIVSGITFLGWVCFSGRAART